MYAVTLADVKNPPTPGTALWTLSTFETWSKLGTLCPWGGVDFANAYVVVCAPELVFFCAVTLCRLVVSGNDAL